jgi:hypothetical protein
MVVDCLQRYEVILCPASEVSDIIATSSVIANFYKQQIPPLRCASVGMTNYVSYFSLAALVRGGDPEGVGVKEEKENHAEGHEIHVDEEEDATVVEAPAALHATNGVRSAGGGGEGGEDEAWGAVDLREAGEEDCREETDQDKEDAAEEGSLARIEKAGEHAILID